MKQIQYTQPNIAVTILFNVYVVIWWLEIGKRKPALGSIRLEFILGAVLGVLALISYFRQKKAGGESSDIVRWVFTLLVVLLLSLPFAENIHVAWFAYVNKVLKYAVLTFFISQFVTSPETLKLFSFSTFLAFLKIGQEAMVGKLSGSMVWQNQGIPRLHGAQGTMFGHPNSLSGKTLSLVPFLLYLFPVLKKRWVKILLIIQLIFSVNIVLFTGSRTGYVTLLFMLALMIILSAKKFRYILFIVIIGIIAIVSVPEVYKNRFMSSFTGQEVEGKSKDARKGLFKDSLTVFAENPLGVGLNCFTIAQKQAGRRAQDTHNLYTQLLAETGVQGFVAFMLLVSVLISRVRRLRVGYRDCVDKLLSMLDKEVDGYRQSINQELEQCRFLYSISTALFVFLILRLGLGVFGHDLLEIYWWVSAGLAISLGKMLEIANARVDEIMLNGEGGCAKA